jgi:hypothetical protein
MSADSPNNGGSEPPNEVDDNLLRPRRSPRLAGRALSGAASTAPASRPRNLLAEERGQENNDDDHNHDEDPRRPTSTNIRSRINNQIDHPRSRSGSGPRFSVAEMESMLTAIEQFLPMGPDEWERVAEWHNSEFPSTNREAQSLRRKFQSLYNIRIPTGDPECPAHVRRAKRLRYSIEQRADSSNLTSGSRADLGFSEGNDNTEDEGANDGELLERTATEGGENAGTNRVLFNGGADVGEEQQPLTTDEERQRQELSSGTRRHVAPPRFPRPLVARTPTSMGSSINISTAAARIRSREELQELVLTNMVTRMQQEDTDREERRMQQQQFTVVMVTSLMAFVSALNPAAAAAATTATSAIVAASTTPAAQPATPTAIETPAEPPQPPDSTHTHRQSQ